MLTLYNITAHDHKVTAKMEPKLTTIQFIRNHRRHHNTGDRVQCSNTVVSVGFLTRFFFILAVLLTTVPDYNFNNFFPDLNVFPPRLMVFSHTTSKINKTFQLAHRMTVTSLFLQKFCLVFQNVIHFSVEI